MPRKVRPIPPELERFVPKNIEKGIYYRVYTAKDGTVSLKWWVKVFDKNSKPIYQSTRTPKYEDAEKLKKKLIGQVESGTRAGGDSETIRVGKLLEEWLSVCQASEATKKVYRYTLDRNLKPFFGKTKVSKLTTDKINKYRRKRVAEIVAKKNPTGEEELIEAERAANVTVNRDLTNLRTALRYGTTTEPPKVLRVPHFHMADEDNARSGFVEPDQYGTVRDAFKDPSVRLLFIVSYNIGCRSGELRQIEWSMVDFKEGVIRLPGRITKNRKPRTVPIFEGDMMESLKAEKKQHDEYYPESPWVFSRMGEAIKSFYEEWQNTCQRAGCSGLMFHDLRRTAVRNMVRIHKLDRQVAKKISGHLTDSMFERYNIIDEEDILAAKAKVDANGTAPKAEVIPSTVPEMPCLPPDVVAKLSAVPPEKLAALVAFLTP